MSSTGEYLETALALCFVLGGLAGAASRITGAMAKGVAAITMDEDYQQKRREAMNKQPTGLREGITRGGKGLVSVRRKKIYEKINEFYAGKSNKYRGCCRHQSCYFFF